MNFTEAAFLESFKSLRSGEAAKALSSSSWSDFSENLLSWKFFDEDNWLITDPLSLIFRQILRQAIF